MFAEVKIKKKPFKTIRTSVEETRKICFFLKRLVLRFRQRSEIFYYLLLCNIEKSR